MGPGLAVKSLAGRRFSLIAFGIAQAAMDIEPLIGLLRGASVLHGPTHTYLAALGIAALATFATLAFGRHILRYWNGELIYQDMAWLGEAETFTPGPVILGAFTGTLSHILLDSFMHADITPFAPWSNTNGLLGRVSVETLQDFCLFSGIFGAAIWAAARWRWRQVYRRVIPRTPED